MDIFLERASGFYPFEPSGNKKVVILPNLDLAAGNQVVGGSKREAYIAQPRKSPRARYLNLHNGEE